MLILRALLSFTIKILSIGAGRSEQTVETQIRLLQMEQSDQGLHCLQFDQHFWVHYSTVKPNCLNFRTIIFIILDVSIFLIFMVRQCQIS